MNLSKTELRVLEQLAEGKNRIRDIADALKKSDKQVYRSGKKLAEKGIIKRSEGILEPGRTVYTNLLLQLLSENPNIIRLLSGSGIEILVALASHKTIPTLIKETGLKKSMIYNKLKDALSISVIKKEKKQYILNDQLWNTLREFLSELKKYSEATDIRIPANSIIYCKTGKEIVFSNKAELDAAITGFSAFEKFGIKILLLTHYYYLPKKLLTKAEIFQHSLRIVEKERTVRNLTYAALFYIKFRKELFRIKHEIIDNINRILEGKIISGYPSLEEIKEKAEIYDIRL